MLAGSICYLAVQFREWRRWDDALDVWAAHGIGGLMGVILLGVFASLTVNAAGADVADFNRPRWRELILDIRIPRVNERRDELLEFGSFR